MLKIKRGVQLLILAILVSGNWQLAAARIDACEDNGPEWCCENIACPINQDLCTVNGGTPDDCGWDAGSQTCEVGVCEYD